MQTHPNAGPSTACYVNKENIARLHKLITISENDPARNEMRHQTLLQLLAEEEAKDFS
jgi:hypothetical protein